ncbi:MAG: chemotaxis response regulator protein-glutamate methylesterase [Oscillospiraceae bacterium]|jgi:two-component system chemotaxis response regulator CheB|nr:chemotaxis response regulator protein-glutamate methylesterase [Oscillospiraceae bacterium]
MDNKKIRVLIVDDSVMFRTMLTKSLASDPKIEVIGTAEDPFIAKDKIMSLKPDVLTLDVEMPKMNGLDFLRKLLPQYSIPVIVITSSPTQAFEAISAGAVEFMKKPSHTETNSWVGELCDNIKSAVSAKVSVPRPASQLSHMSSFAASPKTTVSPVSIMKTGPIDQNKNRNKIIALGASTGGTEALAAVVKDFPKDLPGTVIVQHMPAGFTNMYAERLNRQCRMEVREAKDGDRLHTGLILIGAGDFHLTVEKDLNGYFVRCKKGEKVSGHCPSVDVMFESVSKYGANAVGAILTGMGADGAEGLLKMRNAGAYTIGQDKETCVVYGMPMVAYNKGGVVTQAPLTQIASLIVNKMY